MIKVLNWQEAAEWRKRIAGKLVFTNGVFDILHRGHAEYLAAARRLGDALIVGVNSDASAKLLNKAPDRPFNQAEDRAFLVLQLKPVDAVVIFDQPTPAELIEHLLPDLVAKGGDYTPDTVVGKATMDRSGGEVVIIPLTEGISTTNLVKRIKKSRF